MKFPVQIERDEGPVAAALSLQCEFELPELLPRIPQYFSANERAYIDSLQYPLRRHSYLLGRFAAKEAVQEITSCENPLTTEIGRGIFGQPLVVCNPGTPVELSLAHSFGTAVAIACALGHPIAVDIECMRSRKVDFLHSSFTDAERVRLGQIRLGQNEAYYLGWTIKEALSKVIRCGLTVPFEVLELSKIQNGPSGCYESEFRKFTQYKACSWVIDRYALSIVLPKRSTLNFTPSAEFIAHLAKAHRWMAEQREDGASDHK